MNYTRNFVSEYCLQIADLTGASYCMLISLILVTFGFFSLEYVFHPFYFRFCFCRHPASHAPIERTDLRTKKKKTIASCARSSYLFCCSGRKPVPDRNASSGQHVQPVLRARAYNADDNGTGSDRSRLAAQCRPANCSSTAEDAAFW